MPPAEFLSSRPAVEAGAPPPWHHQLVPSPGVVGAPQARAHAQRLSFDLGTSVAPLSLQVVLQKEVIKEVPVHTIQREHIPVPYIHEVERVVKARAAPCLLSTPSPAVKRTRASRARGAVGAQVPVETVVEVERKVPIERIVEKTVRAPDRSRASHAPQRC